MVTAVRVGYVMSGWLWVLVVVYCDHMIKLIVVLTDNAPHCIYLCIIIIG